MNDENVVHMSYGVLVSNNKEIVSHKGQLMEPEM